MPQSRFTLYVAAALAGAALGACAPLAADRLGPTGEGLWRSQGYSRILEIRAGDYQVYELTPVSCLVNAERPLSDVNLELSADAEELAILEGYDRYRYDRIEALPERCATADPEAIDPDPVRALDVFLATIEDNFAYFDLADLDWPALKRATRSRVTSETSDADLYLAMDHVLVALNDGHGSVSPNTEITFPKRLEEEASAGLRDYGDFELGALLRETHFSQEITEGSRLLRWGRIGGDIGYIQLDAMFLHARFPELSDRVAAEGFFSVYQSEFERGGTRLRLEREISGVGAAMSRAMEDLRSSDAIVIDLRWNGGGLDEVGLEVLRHFNDERRLVLRKKARHRSGFTEPQEIFLESVETPFEKPVFILVSPQTGSASETFAMVALALPHLQLAGSRTMGALSDSFDRRLPNGWSFSMSNEIYETLDGGVYEAVGVPVDIELNYPRDRQTFFRALANNREADQAEIVALVETHLARGP